MHILKNKSLQNSQQFFFVLLRGDYDISGNIYSFFWLKNYTFSCCQSPTTPKINEKPSRNYLNQWSSLKRVKGNLKQISRLF